MITDNGVKIIIQTDDGIISQITEQSQTTSQSIDQSSVSTVGIDFNYLTEVCSLELLISEYIAKLASVAETLTPDNKLASNDINQVIYLVRLLREWTIRQLSIYANSPVNVDDPFFAQVPMPQIVIVHESDFKPTFVMPISVYLYQLSVRYSGTSYDGELAAISENLFKVGVNTTDGSGRKHFLMLPDPTELLRAAKDNELFTTAAY